MLVLRWMEGSANDSAYDAIDKKLSRLLPSFDVNTEQINDICVNKYSNRGEFSCLVLKVTFFRFVDYSE